MRILDQECAALGVGGRTLLLKNPWDTRRLSFIAAAYPDAGFLILKRDPCDVVASQFNAIKLLLFGPLNRYHACLDLTYPALWRRARSFSGFADMRFGQAALMLMLAVRLKLQQAALDRALRQIDPVRYLALRYEDWRSDPQAVLNRILSFADLADRETQTYAISSARQMSRPPSWLRRLLFTPARAVST